MKRTPPAVALYHRFENDLFGQALLALRDQGQVVVLPRLESQTFCRPSESTIESAA